MHVAPAVPGGSPALEISDQSFRIGQSLPNGAVTRVNDVTNSTTCSYMPSRVIDQWTTHLRAEGKANRTVKDRRTTLRRLENDLGAPILGATTGDLAEWLSRDDLAPVTRSVYHSMIVGFFGWAISVGHHPGPNPMDPIRAAKRPRRQPRPLTPVQYRRLLDEAGDDHSMRAMLLLAGMQGLRVHEIARFHSRHLDVEARTLEVVGKGGTSYLLPAAAPVIDHARHMPVSGFWFPSQRAKHLGGRTVSERIHLHMIRARVPGTPHALRHTYGTELVAGGTDLRVAQELLRHSSLQTTAIYVAASDERKRDAITRLESLVA
ncbi:tyrosine integrase [Gordonia phage Santhid]|uniref:Integrase n=1 Tax=Gordonia phage Santhid TaxID=2927281 RepID=A0AAE9GKI1_9CAUD|nr:tyrosine integrase [Gordonia phage Santhid]UOK18024.1 tyrosine integrase [Gordonia phage Santhid]